MVTKNWRKKIKSEIISLMSFVGIAVDVVIATVSMKNSTRIVSLYKNKIKHSRMHVYTKVVFILYQNGIR